MTYITEIIEEIKQEDGQNVSKDHLFKEWLKYEGIHGYDKTIKAAIKMIYGLDVK
jgi:hypothetical protein